MLAAAQALPDVQSAVLSDSTTVAILYNDGTEHIIDLLPVNGSSNDLAPTTAKLAAANPYQQLEMGAQHLTNDVDLPTSRTAYLYDAVPISFNALALPYPPTLALAHWFNDAGYATVVQAGSVSDLMNIQNAAAFVLNAHGGFGQASSGYETYTSLTRVFGIASTVPYSDAVVDQLLEPIKKGELGIYTEFSYTEADGQINYTAWDWVFFTPQFVRDYMTFAQNSLLVMNVCSLMSSDPAAEDMVQAFFDAGAGAVLGWDDKAGSLDAVDTTWFFLDRVLGAGSSESGGYSWYAVTPPAPPNRPFDAGSVYEEISATKPAPMTHKFTNPDYGNGFGGTFITSPVNLNTAAYVEKGYGPVYATLRLKFSDKPLSAAVALVPTISAVSLQNNMNQLTLSGEFGGSYTSRSVTIGGTPVPANWTPNSITVTSLPLSGSGSGGYVQVTINGASSNQVLINQWNSVPLTMITGPRTVTCNVNLRSSFESLRLAPDQPPTADAVTTDNAVLQNGTCSFVSSDPAGGGDLPWFNTYAPGATTVPDTFANVWSTGQTSDGSGGGTVGLSIQASYNGGSINFLDTSATKGVGQQLVFDDAAQGLAAGLSTQYGPDQEVLDTFQWAATAAATTRQTTPQAQAVQMHRP
jgi:hypothetical protein